MARRGSARTGPRSDPEETSLPLWVAGLSTLGAVLLFFNTTAPALRESGFLNRTHRSVASQQRDLLESLNQATSRRVALQLDPAAVSRELLRRGISPETVLQIDPPQDLPPRRR